MGIYTFTQDNLIIPLCSGATSCTAELNLDSFHMKGYDQATVVMQFSSVLSGDNVLSFECGSTDGADTADATFHHRVGLGDIPGASSDVLAADATSSALTLTNATYESKMLVCEIHADELPKSGENVYDWVTVNLDGTCSDGSVTAFAILSKPRYAKAVMPTALV